MDFHPFVLHCKHGVIVLGEWWHTSQSQEGCSCCDSGLHSLSTSTAPCKCLMYYAEMYTSSQDECIESSHIPVLSYTTFHWPVVHMKTEKKNQITEIALVIDHKAFISWVFIDDMFNSIFIACTPRRCHYRNWTVPTHHTTIHYLNKILLFQFLE